MIHDVLLIALHIINFQMFHAHLDLEDVWYKYKPRHLNMGPKPYAIRAVWLEATMSDIETTKPFVTL
jgi:uncharacterized MAPEG superfamily protein